MRGVDTQQLEYNSPGCACHRWGLQLLETVAQQPAKMLCMEEAAFSAPIMGLCNWLHIYTGLVAASLTILRRQSCVVLPILGCWCSGSLAAGFGQYSGGKLSSWGAGQPPDIGLCLKNMESFHDPCS